MHRNDGQSHGDHREDRPRTVEQNTQHEDEEVMSSVLKLIGMRSLTLHIERQRNCDSRCGLSRNVDSKVPGDRLCYARSGSRELQLVRIRAGHVRNEDGS